MSYKVSARYNAKNYSNNSDYSSVNYPFIHDHTGLRIVRVSAFLGFGIGSHPTMDRQQYRIGIELFQQRSTSTAAYIAAYHPSDHK